MPVRRCFLGWDQPLTAKVGRFLILDHPEKPVSLESDLIIVPTQQAGRSLRQSLAFMCSEKGTALVSAQVVMPSFFLQAPEGAKPDAGAAEVRAVWAEVLLNTDRRVSAGLVPVERGARDFPWAVRLGETVQGLREELAEAGLSIAEALTSAGSAIEEPERWKSLAHLESLYLGKMTELGLCDGCDRKIRQSRNPRLPDGIRRIVIASVPDPLPLVLKCLETLSGTIQVDVLIWADESASALFDEWGRPLAGEWKSVELDAPNLVLAGTPASQARAVMSAMKSVSDRFGPRDIAIGVPDREVIPFIEQELAESGLSGFDPSDVPLQEHPLFHLVETFGSLSTTGDYASISAFLRNADVLRMLDRDCGLKPSVLLTELDRFQNERFPRGLADFETAGIRYETLGRAISEIRCMLGTVTDSGVASAIRGLLGRVFGPVEFSKAAKHTREFKRAAECIEFALAELSSEALSGLLKGPSDAFDLLVRDLSEQTYHRDRNDELVDLEGWLELPWNDAPALIVTGMNEGSVPATRRGDQFLPNSIRKALGLRDDDQWVAREAFLMKALVESRRAAGWIGFIAGKTRANGDPLKPSRLLFRCADKALLDRAAMLFAKRDPERIVFPPTVSFKLNPARPRGIGTKSVLPERMSVTSFRDYLACPFRFYLKHVLGMEELSDTGMSLDQLQFGTLVHDVLRTLGEDKDMRTSANERQIKEFLVAGAERQAVLAYGNAMPVSVTIAMDSVIQRLSRAASVQAALVREGWEIIECEKKYSIQVGGITITGKVDRIDRHSKTGAVRVLDYKTSEKAEEPDGTHLGPASGGVFPGYMLVEVNGRQRKWIDLQLPLYLMMWEAGGPVEAGYFNLPRAVSETGVRTWPDLKGSLLDAARACADGVAKDVRAGRFWPPSERVKYDDFARLFGGWSVADCVTEPKVSNGK